MSDPSQPPKAIGIDRMDQQGRNPLGQAAGLATLEPIHLRTRTREAFDAVCRGERHQHALRVPRPKPGNIGAERATVRTPLGVGNRQDL